MKNKRDLTGNLYMRNRYYDAQAGRFSQEDPIGLAGGLNAYGFANGDPVSYSDPYGLAACPTAPEGDPRRDNPSWSDCTAEELRLAQGAVDEPLLLDPIIVVGVARGGYSLLRAGWRGLTSLGARFFGREAATIAGTFGSKAAAREFAAGLGLAESQAAAVNRAIGRATASSTIGIASGEGGSVVVSITRAGRNGRQVVESTVARDGTKTVVQKAYNAAGELVHYDPKTP